MKKVTQTALIVFTLLFLVAGVQVIDVAKANFIPGYIEVIIDSPTQKNYDTDSVALSITVRGSHDYYANSSERSTRWIGYSLDGAENVSLGSGFLVDGEQAHGSPIAWVYSVFIVNSTLSNLTEGQHNLVVSAENKYNPDIGEWNLDNPYIMSANSTTNFNVTKNSNPTPSPSLIELPYAAGNFSPTPNSTNIPLNTTISIFLSRPASICNLSITPNVAIKERVFEADGFSGTYIFYLAEQLKPQTTYTVTITYGQETASEGFAPTSTKTWTFKTATASPTTDNDFKTEYYVPIIIIISLIVLIVALAVVYFKKNKNRRLC